MVALDFGPVQDSHARLRRTLAGLTDAGARRPSLLPGWTVGHVLTHLARNGDSHVRMLDGARPSLDARLPARARVDVASLDRRRLLAWLVGRGNEPELPALAPWSG
jgi:uncharacterized protein (TIGR03083 family)